jgi:hypothetical protein
MKAFDVYINDKKVNTVYGDDDISAEDMRDSLINHDGLSSQIEVIKRNL